MSEEVKNPEAVLAELRRAQEDLKALREQVSTLTSAKEAAEAALEKATEEAKGNVWKQRAINSEARSALLGQGIKDADRFMKFIDVEKLDFDDEGKLTGLDETLGQLKKDLPEVFDPKKRVGGGADIFAGEEANSKPNPLLQQVKAALTH